MTKAKQMSMFGLKRRSPRVMAHVIDAGHWPGRPGDAFGAMYRCDRCGWTSEWISGRSVSDHRRGWPCPNCNEA